MECYDVDSSKFPSVKIPRLSFQEDSKHPQVGGQMRKASFEISYSLDLDLHTKANNLAPKKYKEVVNLSGLVFYKGSNTKEEK